MRTLIPLLALFSVGLAGAQERPNILFILADDLGWSDLGCYGHDFFETPHLDRLASEGIRFTEAYAAAPICSASRAAVLTGNSTARNRFEFVVKETAGRQELPVPLNSPPFVLNLPLKAKTLPEILAQSGYSSAFFGKWHLNAHHQRYLGWSPTHGPKGQGFTTAEEDFGSHPYSYWKHKELRSFDDSLIVRTFPEDGVTQRAIRFLEQEHDEPFLLMVSHFFVHDPNHTRLRWLHHHYLEKLLENTQNREGAAHYGSMVTTLDHHVGQLLKALDDTGKRDSTLVVFTSDNGGHPNYAGNAPLRGSKWNLYEGGIRVPFLVRWPGVTPNRATCSSPVWSPDLAPTFAEIAGTPANTASDGRSLAPLFRAPDKKTDDRSLIWHFPYYHPEKQFDERIKTIGIDDGETSQTRPHSAIRNGDWKLLHFYEDDRDELYHLAEDLSEEHNLADTRPAKTAELRKTLLEYLEKVDARLPTPNPDFEP